MTTMQFVVATGFALVVFVDPRQSRRRPLRAGCCTCRGRRRGAGRGADRRFGRAVRGDTVAMCSTSCSGAGSALECDSRAARRPARLPRRTDRATPELVGNRARLVVHDRRHRGEGTRSMTRHPGHGQRDDGFAATELVLGVGLLLVPVALLVLTLPTWSERQTTAPRHGAGDRTPGRGTGLLRHRGPRSGSGRSWLATSVFPTATLRCASGAHRAHLWRRGARCKPTSRW